jgi:hypothetical protein
VAKEQVSTCPEVLGHVHSAAKQEVLDILPLLWRVASLDPVTAMVLVCLVLELATLPATLLKEATDGNATQVACIAIAMCDLQPPEINYGRDVGVDYAPCQERPPACGRRHLSCKCQGRGWHVALAVVRK